MKKEKEKKTVFGLCHVPFPHEVIQKTIKTS